jgi:hypothetical protein
MRFAETIRPGLLTVALCAAVCGRSSLAAAQVASPQTAPPPAPEPPAAPPPPAEAPAAPIIRPYATIKPTIVVAGSPVESFNQANATAATAAGNPVITAVQDEASTTFQVGQSRLGFWFNEKGKTRGQFELDFIDFTKSSPTVGALPRLRIAKVEWSLSDSTVLMAGQDWDLFSPVNGYTLNIVSVAYQAGNSAFMRQQAKLIWHNDSLELATAIGLAGINNGAKALLPEYSRIPTVAARAALLFGAAGRVGISGIATSWRFAPDQPTERDALAGGASLYGDLTLAERFTVRFEAYVGRNLANIGALTLGQGNPTDDIDEVGGFLSAKLGLNESHALYVLGGMAKVLNDDKVVPSYTYPTIPADGTAPANSTAAPGAGPGMKQNMVLRLGYEYRFDKTLAVMLEGFYFDTEHVLNATYDADLDGHATALGSELGLMFTF